MKSHHADESIPVLWRVSVPAGLAAFASRLAQRDFGEDCSPGHDDSTVSFSAPLRMSAPPPWASSAGVIIAQLPPSRAESTAGGLEAAAKALHLALCAREGKPGGSQPASILAAIALFHGRDRSRTHFALRSFIEGSPSPLNPAERGRLEGAIRSITGLTPDSRSPAFEFQLALRKDGSAALLWNRFPSQTGRGEAGALPPSTARLLVELSRPAPNDVFLDPFAGSGAIPLERARLPYRMIFSGDCDEAQLARVKAVLSEPRMAKKRKTIFPKLLDARELSRFEDRFFTAIVTDPPWGRHEALGTEALEELYRRFLGEAARILTPGGRLVLLCGRSGLVADGSISIKEQFEEEGRYEVLISGQKALVLCLVRKGPFTLL